MQLGLQPDPFQLSLSLSLLLFRVPSRLLSGLLEPLLAVYHVFVQLRDALALEPEPLEDLVRCFISISFP